MKKQGTTVKARKRGRPKKDYKAEHGITHLSGVTVRRVLKPTPEDGHGGPRAEAKCSCGNIFEARLYDIKSGHTDSCGCLRREVYKAWCNDEVSNLPPERTAEIWELRRSGVDRNAVAARFEIRADFVDFANRTYEAQLDAIAMDLAKSASPAGVIAEAELSRVILERRLSNSGVAPFDLRTELKEGDEIHFCVLSGPALADGTFDFTALRFTVSDGRTAISMPRDFPKRP